jgi:hypothetical protein
MMRRERYADDWEQISLAIRARAQQRCECTGQCGAEHGGRCDAPNGTRIDREEVRPWRWRPHVCDTMCVTEKCWGTRVILTVAHVDHVETNNAPGNLLALCQRCHLTLDRGDNLARRRERVHGARGQQPLPGFAVLPENRGGAR